MRYLLFWDISSAEPKDHQILGGPHGATILDRIMKMKQQRRPPPPKKAKMHHFPILVWRGGGINFASIRTNIEDSIAEYLILITQDCAMKFLPQAAQYHGHL